MFEAFLLPLTIHGGPMRTTLTLFGRAPRTAVDSSSESYEVSLLRKLPRYHANTGMVSANRHEWVYSTIVEAISPGFAAYEALYEYFVSRLTNKWQSRRRPLTRCEMILIDLFSKDLAESAMRRFNTRSEMIHALVTPWASDRITVRFEAHR